MFYTSNPRLVLSSMTALFIVWAPASCSSNPSAVVSSPKPVLTSSTDTIASDARTSAASAPSVAAAKPVLVPKKLRPEQPFVLAARFEEPMNLGFAAGRVFAMLREDEPPKRPDQDEATDYWMHVFELRGNKFQAVTKRKFKGDMNFSQIVEKNGKPYIGGYDPNSRTGLSEFEPIDAKDKRISNTFGSEEETPVPPECENPAATKASILPMRDLYWYMKQKETLFYMGTSCDGKANVQTVTNGQARMTAVEPSDQLSRTDLGIVYVTAADYSLYEKNAFVRFAPALPELPRDLMRAPDGTILALGKSNFALRTEGWTEWLLEDARSEFTIVSDGVNLWAYVGGAEVTELHRYVPKGAKRGEPIDTSGIRLPGKKR